LSCRWSVPRNLKLMRDCGFKKKTEFMNNAFSLMKWAVRHLKTGESIAAVNEGEDRYTELAMPFFSVVQKKAGAPVKENQWER
jgi:hypothetical protein